jgi:predicted nuclease of restriction endonuclease-like (RecB) superfamily
MEKLTTYWELVEQLKQEIKTARVQAVLTVNAQMLELYWKIGYAILQQQQQEGWGAKVIDRLATDLRTAFPDMKGISARNLKYMRAFAEAWPDFVQVPLAQNSALPLTAETGSVVQAPLAQIAWYHHITILDKLKGQDERLFYIRQAALNGWSRNVLVHQIESRLHERQGKLQHNFPSTLPAVQGDLAKELFKDPYKFDFLQLSAEAQERDLENALVDNITKFLLEMGRGFSYVGRQVHLEKGGQDYYIDLLFYHLKLHCYVVIELKIGDFKPEYAGKMNFYLSAVDEDLKTEDDSPSIGLILCKSKNKVTVEYALRDMNKPMGVAEYELTEAMPLELQGELPTIEALEQELEREIDLPVKPLDQKLQQLKDLLAQVSKEEEVQQEKDHAALRYLFDHVLSGLIVRINQNLAEVLPLFNTVWLTKQVNHTAKPDYTLVEFEQMLMAGNTINQIGLNMRLDGFKKAGTKAFGISKDLIFTLEKFKYDVGPYRDSSWFEKLYHQQWQEDELEALADRWCESVIEDITANLNRIKQI